MSPGKLRNTPPSLYQNSNITPRLYGENCKFCTTPLSDKSQKRLVHKENQTKYRNMTKKPRSHVRIVIYRTWAIRNAGQLQVAICFHRLCVRKLKPLRSQKVKPGVQLKQGRHQTTTMRSRRGFFFQGEGRNLESARTTKSCFQALRGKENQRTPGLSELATQQNLLKHVLCRQCILWVQIKGDCNFLLVFFSLVCPFIFCVKQLNVRRSRAGPYKGNSR